MCRSPSSKPAPGDANGDRQFNSADITQVLAAGKYETGQPASWEEGDWNSDGVFNSADIVLAQDVGHFIYEQGPYAASSTAPVPLTAIASAAHANGTAQAAADTVFSGIGGRALATNEANLPVPEQEHAGQLRTRNVSTGTMPFRFRQPSAHNDIAEVPLSSPFPSPVRVAIFGDAWLDIAPGEGRPRTRL